MKARKNSRHTKMGLYNALFALQEIFVDSGLILEYIQSSSCNPSCLQCMDQSGFIDDSATCGIDEEDTILHLSEFVMRNEMFCTGIQGTVDGHNFRCLKEVGERWAVGYAIFPFFL